MVLPTECKRCLLSELTREAYETVQQYLDAMDPALKCDEAEYARRLSLCRKCEHLIGGMCGRCGCFVELRAAKKAMGCPDYYGGRWDKAEAEKGKDGPPAGNGTES